MEQSIRISSTGKLRSNKHQTKKNTAITISKAYYLNNYSLLLFFNNGEQKIIDFLPVFSKYAQGAFSKYKELNLFKKLIVANGNIYWGKNEDLIFPISFLYNLPHTRKIKEEILYVI